MKLGNLTNWTEIEKFLDKKIGIHNKKNCSEFNANHSCNHCTEYFYFVSYQQEIASTKYKNENSPIKKWESFF